MFLSHHFDAVERGFSFRGTAPLDMRMNRRGGRTAADVVNTYDRDALTRVLGDWGRTLHAVEGRGLHRAGPCRRADHNDRRAGSGRGAVYAQTGGGEVPHQALSGVAHRGQRRNGGAADGARTEPSGAAAGRSAGGDLLPFARRPAGQEFPAQRQLRRPCREGFLRPCRKSFHAPYPQGRHAFARRAGAQSRSRSAKLRAAIKNDR